MIADIYKKYLLLSFLLPPPAPLIVQNPQNSTMKAWLAFAVAAAFVASAAAEEDFFDAELAENEGRFLYFNTSSTATSLTLLGALILLGVIAYLVYAGGLLGSSSGYNRNDYAYPEQYNYEQQYAQFRYNEGRFKSLPLSLPCYTLPSISISLSEPTYGKYCRNV